MLVITAYPSVCTSFREPDLCAAAWRLHILCQILPKSDNTHRNLYWNVCMPWTTAIGCEVVSVTAFSARVVCVRACVHVRERERDLHSNRMASALAAAHLCISDSSRSSLTEAVKVTGDTYCEIGQLFENQPKLDWEPLGDVLHLYKGILASYPDILTVHRVSEMYCYVVFLRQLV
jgi:hypothetical protein